jgi:uncharacterized protein (DUF697 family)
MDRQRSDPDWFPEAPPAADLPGTWEALAAASAAELKQRLGRYAQLGEKDRDRLAHRLRLAIDSALEVPDHLPQRIAASVARFHARSVERDPVALAWRRTRQRARRTAAIGAVTTVPAMAPGIGPALAALGLVADWRFVAEQQRDLVLEIAALLGVTLDNPTNQIRALFLASTASAFGATAAGEAAVHVLARQIARRSIARVVPGAGAIVAGALNYVATVALGRAAIEHFAHRAGHHVEGVVPHFVHPAMPWLRNQVVRALESLQLVSVGTPVFSEQDVAMLAELPREQKEELLDLAVACAAADGVATADEERVVREIAELLGFRAHELDAAQRAAAADASTSARRVTRLLARARQAGSRTTREIWHRAARLARGRRPPRGFGEPPDGPEDSARVSES